jgi:hypothetical protein
MVVITSYDTLNWEVSSPGIRSAMLCGDGPDMSTMGQEDNNGSFAEIHSVKFIPNKIGWKFSQVSDSISLKCFKVVYTVDLKLNMPSKGNYHLEKWQHLDMRADPVQSYRLIFHSGCHCY